MLSAQNRSDQIENAILTLQSADNLLRGEKGITGRPVFSRLSELLHRNQGDARRLGSLLTSLFSHQNATKKESKSAKNIPKINSQLGDLLKAAGFEVPESVKAE